MTKQEIAPTAPAVQIVSFTLDDLILSPLNPRQEASAAGIAALAASIRAVGLMQNLGGYPTEDGRIGIVAGGRRLRALALLAETGEAPEFIPVKLARDEAEARMWAATENHQREALHPADEIRAFYQMALGGAAVAEIASAFGETEQLVRRRLRLGGLPEPVLAALKAGQINLDMAAAFAASEDESLIFATLGRVTAGGYWDAAAVRRMVLPDTVAATDRRAVFVGLDAYQVAGGKLTADLFTEKTSLHSPDLLDRLFAEKLEAEAGKAFAAGWVWAEICPDSDLDWSLTRSFARVYPIAGELNEAQKLRYDTLSAMAEQGDLDEEQETELDALDAILEGCITAEQRAVSGLYLHVNWRGDLVATTGLVRDEDVTAAVEAGFIDAETAEKRLARAGEDAARAEKSKPELSAALVDDLRAMRSAAIQGRMLDKPELALDLLAFTMLRTHGGPLGIRRDESNIAPSVGEGFTPDPRLAGIKDAESEDFASFRAKGRKHRNAILAHALARTLKYGGTDWAERPDPIFAGIETEVGASIREVWTPTAANFLGRVNSAYLDRLMAELTGCDREGAEFKAFIAAKKKAKAETLERLFTDAGTQRLWKIDAEAKARIAAWQPSGF